MTQENILKCKELQNQLGELIKKYYNEYLKNLCEEFSGWRWSSENSNEIIIIYRYLNYFDDWDEDETYVTVEELSNFKPNDY